MPSKSYELVFDCSVFLQELIDPFRLVSQIKTIKDRLEVTKVKMAELEKLKNEVHRELELKIEGLQPRVESLEK